MTFFRLFYHQRVETHYFSVSDVFHDTCQSYLSGPPHPETLFYIAFKISDPPSLDLATEDLSGTRWIPDPVTTHRPDGLASRDPSTRVPPLLPGTIGLCILRSEIFLQGTRYAMIRSAEST